MVSFAPARTRAAAYPAAAVHLYIEHPDAGADPQPGLTAYVRRNLTAAQRA